MRYHQFVTASLLWAVLMFLCLVWPINSQLEKNGACEAVNSFIFFGWPQNGMFLADVEATAFTSFEKCQFFVDRSIFSITLALWLIIALFWKADKRYKVFMPSFLIVWSIGFLISLTLTLLPFEKNYDIYMISQKDPLYISLIKSYVFIFLFYYSLQMTLYMLVSGAIKVGRVLRLKN